jgi:Trk K+ transport system NAD-binding subunit
VSRDGSTSVPNADFTLEVGDRVTVIGGYDDVSTTMSLIHPEE